MSVHSAMGHDLCPIGLACCEVTIGKSQFRHMFIVCKRLQKELVIGLDMQHLHHLGCDCTNDGQMFLHQGVNILSNSIDVVADTTILKNY